jgi:hypothetical protein
MLKKMEKKIAGTLRSAEENLMANGRLYGEYALLQLKKFLLAEMGGNVLGGFAG